MTIRSKIALVFTLMTGTILLLLIGCVYILSIQHAHTIFFTRLKVRASLAAESHFGVTEINSSVVKEIRERHLQRLPREKEYFIYDDSLYLEHVQQQVRDIPESCFHNIKQKRF